MLRFCPLSLRIMEKTIEIREAEREDCQEIRCLIQELAEFEEMPDGPKVDFEILERDGFDTENPLFKCYVAVCDNRVVGYALYFYIYSTLDEKAIHLEDLYVTPEFRKKYVGSRLFDIVAKKTFNEKCQYLDFAVLSWNPAQNFYKAKGSIDLTEMNGWNVYRIKQKSLQNLASKLSKNNYNIREASFDDFHSIKRLAQESNSQRIKNVPNLNDVSITIEENSRKEFDGKNPYFGYLVVELNHKIIGYALYCYSYSTWEGKSMYLQEFYVSPNEYKTSMRSNLLSAVATKACLENCCRIDFWVLDPKNAGQFYKSNGAVNLTESEEWHLYRLFEIKKNPL